MALVGAPEVGDLGGLMEARRVTAQMLFPKEIGKGGQAKWEEKLRAKLLIKKLARPKVTVKIKVTTQTVVNKGFVTKSKTRSEKLRKFTRNQQ